MARPPFSGAVVPVDDGVRVRNTEYFIYCSCQEEGNSLQGTIWHLTDTSGWARIPLTKIVKHGFWSWS